MKPKGTREAPAEGVRHRETTRDERIRVMTLRDDAGMGWTEIGKKLGIDRRTVQKIYQRTKRHGTPSNRKRSGRPPIFNDAEKKRLIDFITRDAHTRRLSWEAICAEMKYACTPPTVKRVVESMGYHKRVPRRKFDPKPCNKSERLEWCRAHLDWGYEEWKRILWTHESMFSTTGFNHRSWVICKPEEEYHPDCVDEILEQGLQASIVWAGFCGAKKSELVFISGQAKQDSAAYVTTVMEPNLVLFWQECSDEYGWVKVVEDWAPGHRKYAIQYSELNEMDTIQLPPQSPDLNLIESAWLEVEKELGEISGNLGDIEALQAVLRASWATITEERLDSLIRSMPARLKAVIDAEGGATPY